MWGKRASFWARSGSIDICTPSPKKQRTPLSQDLSQMIGEGAAQAHVQVDTGARGSGWTGEADSDDFPAVGEAADDEK